MHPYSVALEPGDPTAADAAGSFAPTFAVFWTGAMSDVTQILRQIDSGDPLATEQLLPLVYDELRQMAAQWLAREKPGQTLQATALVHEAYLRLVSAKQGTNWNSRGHFFAAAAEAMRRILIENARRKGREKHGGGRRRTTLHDATSVDDFALEDLVALDDALAKLERKHPEKAQVVKLRFFAGITIPEVAAAMGISHATAERHWTFARTWLYSEISGGQESMHNK
jgi:RNA polymerase sigma factor (TIGR02999 family)